jgi:hypothetical protein
MIMRTTTPLAFCFGLLLASSAQAVDSLNVRFLGSYNTPDIATCVALQGDYAYVADLDSGLHIISIVDPAHPTEVGYIKMPGVPADVAVSGDYAYIAAYTAGLRVVSIADPIHPAEVGYLPIPGLTRSVAVSGNYAYVANIDSGLLVISVSDPAHPTKIGRCGLPDTAYAVAMTGHLACVADYWHGGLRVMSVANPANPVEVGHNVSLGFKCVTASGNHAYVGSDEDGLYVVSLADSAHPVQVGWSDTGEWVYSAAIDNGHAYATGGSMLYVVSVSNPANPVTVGHYSMHAAGRLAAKEGYIYVTSDSGIGVYQYYGAGVEEDPNVETRATNAEPAIVRGSLFIGKEASLKPQTASLTDASGRKVMDLKRGTNDLGTLAPGVYFVVEQLAVGVRKVIVAR